MNTVTELEQALSVLDPISLTIDDDSALHAGHAGNNGGGHYRVAIVSTAFSGLPLLQRHRLVYDAASALMPSAIHALSIQAKAPEELAD